MSEARRLGQRRMRQAAARGLQRGSSWKDVCMAWSKDALPEQANSLGLASDASEDAITVHQLRAHRLGRLPA